jgi:hypothetical protein
MYVLILEPAPYTGSFVPGEVLLLVRNLGGKQSFFFFSIWAENWAQMGQFSSERIPPDDNYTQMTITYDII